MKNFLKIMSLPIFLAMLMSAASLDVQAQVEINDQSPDGTKGIYKGRECVVVTLCGYKYAIATKNLGAKKETDIGTQTTFKEINDISKTGLSKHLDDWHIPCWFELEEFSKIPSTYEKYKDTQGRSWKIGATILFLPANSKAVGFENNELLFYWSSTSWSQTKEGQDRGWCMISGPKLLNGPMPYLRMSARPFCLILSQ